VSRKGSATARGYGHVHQMMRKRWVPRVAAGLVACARCGELIVPGQSWDLGHIDGDRSRYSGPEHRHARHCPKGGNRATGRHRVEREGRESLPWHSRVW
jgi:hypothetical protein